MTKNTVLTAIAVTGALGYGIALGLARATTYAEKVEEDRYCHTPPTAPDPTRTGAPVT